MLGRHRIAITVLAGLALLAAAGGYGWTRLDASNYGLPSYYVWRSISGKAHGGREAALPGARIYYETFGAGRPVLVLHGGGGFLEVMHYQITALAADRLVIAPDSRGHGRSPDVAGPLHYADMSDDMAALLDRLHIARADVVGWSDGGIVALDMAMRHPGLVGRVVAIGANYDLSGAGAIASAPPADSSDPMVSAVRGFYQQLAPHPEHWPALWNKLLTMWRSEPNYTPAQLATIRAPTLIIAGEHDLVPRAHTDAMARAIPGAREVIVPGAGHVGPLENPAQEDAAILAFLSGTATKTP